MDQWGWDQLRAWLEIRVYEEERGMESALRDTGRAMSEENLEDFIRRPFIAESAHAETAPL